MYRYDEFDQEFVTTFKIHEVVGPQEGELVARGLKFEMKEDELRAAGDVETVIQQFVERA